MLDACKIDAGRNYIPENNIPYGLGFDHRRRVFVTLPRNKAGVYCTLAYFNLDDIKDGQCPPLKCYPSDQENSLDTTCCSDRRLMNIQRANIDSCHRLWGVDKRSLSFNEKSWKQGSPRLFVFDLDTDKVVREALIPSEFYETLDNYQDGLSTVVINADPYDCENAFAYILDSWHGSVIVYSFKQNKFWTVYSPEFFSDAKYSKFTIKTRKNKEVTYWRDELIYDCTKDLKRRECVCHSVASLDEVAVKFDELESEEVARCSPKSLNNKFLGQKCKNCQTNEHVLNNDNQVVWGTQELRYGVSCWNRANPLNPEAVQLVVSDAHKLPYVTHLTLTKEDLPSCGYGRHHDYDRHHSHGYDNRGYHDKDDTYVVVLSNNLVGIEEHGFDSYEENFGIYYVKEKEALHAFPQCLPQQHYKADHYDSSYKPAPYSPAPHKPYHPAPSYKPAPYQPPSYPAPAPKYQPSYSPAPYRPVSYRAKKSDESAAETKEE